MNPFVLIFIILKNNGIPGVKVIVETFVKTEAGTYLIFFFLFKENQIVKVSQIFIIQLIVLQLPVNLRGSFNIGLLWYIRVCDKILKSSWECCNQSCELRYNHCFKLRISSIWCGICQEQSKTVN